MHTTFTFKNIDPSDSLKEYAADKLARFDKYLDNPGEAQVVLMVEKHRHIAEINIAGDRLTINGKEETGDMYSAIDMVLDKLEKQIKKSKQKRQKRRDTGKARERERDAVATASLSDTEDTGEAEIIEESIDYKPMDIEEAAEQLGLSEMAFLVFTNARTGRVNVLYRRKDGHIGLIQPSA
ncbi:MAG: ribosome-associated translation inhibitor RaiA [Thermodesulfobacteriota bacterium]